MYSNSDHGRGLCVDSFVSFKRQEWVEYHTHVSDWELQRYLKFF